MKMRLDINLFLRLKNRFLDSNQYYPGSWHVESDGTVTATNINRDIRVTVGTLADLTAPVHALHMQCRDIFGQPCYICDADNGSTYATLAIDIYGPPPIKTRTIRGWDNIMASLSNLGHARMVATVNYMPISLAGLLSEWAARDRENQKTEESQRADTI